MTNAQITEMRAAIPTVGQDFYKAALMAAAQMPEGKQVDTLRSLLTLEVYRLASEDDN